LGVSIGSVSFVITSWSKVLFMVPATLSKHPTHSGTAERQLDETDSKFVT